MKFRHKCPTCEARHKVVHRCTSCFKLVCSECSIQGKCIDCFTSVEDVREIERYWTEKYCIIT